MKDLKKNPRKQLEKFSTVFMQLGLVLALFIVYTVMEYQTKVEQPVAEVLENTSDYYEIDDNRPVIFKRVEVKQPQQQPVQKPVINDLSKAEVIDNDEEKVIETVIDKPTDIQPQIVDVDKLDEVIDDEPIDDSDVPFTIIEDAPVFKGCEGLSKEANKKCFVEKMTKHVQRNFDASLAEDLGLHSGKHKMYAQFIIDKQGNVVDIQVRAPHKKLKKEATRIVKKIPQFTPGKQRKKPVKVKYTLPITFFVQ